MSLRQVEQLYKKLHVTAQTRGRQKLDPAGRSDIFDKIMEDVERLLKKSKNMVPGSDSYEKVDAEIRLLLMKEIQVIIDDYVMSRHSGTLKQWNAMYGDIQYYVNNYYMYRDGREGDTRTAAHRYGLYDKDHPL
jgi:hypothetical protein